MLDLCYMEPQISETTQVTAKTNPLFVVTPLSKYLALALFIILPFLGFWLGTVSAPFHSQDTIVISTQPVQNAENTQIPAENTAMYTSKDGTFSIAYPAGKVVQPIPSKTIQIGGGTSTATYPFDSFEIPDMFIVSKVPYENLSGKDMVGDKRGTIYDYESCCSGIGYNFDSSKKAWSAATFQNEGQSKPKLLSDAGVCSLATKIGGNTFYRIKQGDEGILTSFHYFLMTNQGYALRFTSKFDLDPSYYTNYAPSVTPDPKLQAEASALLASVKLNGSTKAQTVTCE